MAARTPVRFLAQRLPLSSSSRQLPSFAFRSRKYTMPSIQRHVKIPALYFTLLGPRQFHGSTSQQAGLMPDTENPQPKESEPHNIPAQAAEVTEEEYHQLADLFLEDVLSRVEKMQETEEGLDVEFSAGVMTIELADKKQYVLNKQPPNKQIWLSSPVSGPKRYDWVVVGESMHQKEGSGSANWVYLRDGSRLTDVLRKEIGIDFGADEDAWKPEQSQSVLE